jgi:UPF0716 protein FxsA
MVVLIGLIVVAVAELYVFVQVAQAVGFFTALFGVITVSVIGFSLVRRQGVRTLKRFQSQVRAGRTPDQELAEGLMLLVSGVLLFVPGLLTDAAGLILLLPPIRGVVASSMVRRARRSTSTFFIGGSSRKPGHGGAFDVDGWPEPPEDQRRRGELDS